MTREAELELEIARLRETLEMIAGRRYCLDPLMSNSNIASKALSTPPSTTALQELINEVERRTIERCAEVVHRVYPEVDTPFTASAIRNLPTGNLKLEDLK